jgi:hypothetical protein
MKSLFGKFLFRLARLILSKFNFTITLAGTSSQYPEVNRDELDFISLVHSNSMTMTSFESTITLALACKYIAENDIEGEFVEAGVWRGGSSIIAKKFLTGNRNFYLFDTFKGMTEPTLHDYRVGQEPSDSARELWKRMQKVEHNEWVYASKEEVRANFKRFNLWDGTIKLIEGNVLETLKFGPLPKKISLLRLDTDFYDSTLFELEVLWPLLTKGGVLILDDYGHWDGARRAVDEYFSAEKRILKIPIAGGGGRLVLKT